jgi:hypothetical protein
MNRYHFLMWVCMLSQFPTCHVSSFFVDPTICQAVNAQFCRLNPATTLIHQVSSQHTSQKTNVKAQKDKIETPQQDDIETLRDDIETLKKQVEVLTRDVKGLKANTAIKDLFKGVWSSLTSNAHLFAALRGFFFGIFGFVYVTALIKILSQSSITRCRSSMIP